MSEKEFYLVINFILIFFRYVFLWELDIPYGIWRHTEFLSDLHADSTSWLYMLTPHADCTYWLYVLTIHADSTCWLTCWLYMLTLHADSTCWLYMLTLHAESTCWLYTLTVHADYMLTVHADYTCWLYMLTLHDDSTCWLYLDNFKLNHCRCYVLNYWQCYIYFLLSVEHKYFCVHICTYSFDINFCNHCNKCESEEVFFSFINRKFYGKILAKPKKVKYNPPVSAMTSKMHVSNSSDIGVYCSCLPTCEN